VVSDYKTRTWPQSPKGTTAEQSRVRLGDQKNNNQEFEYKFARLFWDGTGPGIDLIHLFWDVSMELTISMADLNV